MTREVIEAGQVGERRLPMSYEQWLVWADEDVHAEWVEGEVIVFRPASDRHQARLGLLYLLVALYAWRRDLGQVRFAPFEMRLAGAAREPDLLFVARSHLDRLTPQRLVGPADLVVEFVSEESVRRDRSEKFRDYEELTFGLLRRGVAGPACGAPCAVADDRVRRGRRADGPPRPGR